MRNINRLFILTMVLASLSAARADDVTFTGYTNGSFNSTPPNIPGPQSSTLLGLTFTNNSFDNTSSNGFTALDLASLSLFNTVANYDGNTFTLRITFTAPGGITGTNSALFNATLSGSVSSNNGGVFIDFDNTPQEFTFNDGTMAGSFSLEVNDLSVLPSQTRQLTGEIFNATSVPEPSSLALLAVAGGLAAIFFRRRLARA